MGLPTMGGRRRDAEPSGIQRCRNSRACPAGASRRAVCLEGDRVVARSRRVEAHLGETGEQCRHHVARRPHARHRRVRDTGLAPAGGAVALGDHRRPVRDCGRPREATRTFPRAPRCRASRAVAWGSWVPRPTRTRRSGRRAPSSTSAGRPPSAAYAAARQPIPGQVWALESRSAPSSARRAPPFAGAYCRAVHGGAPVGRDVKPASLGRMWLNPYRSGSLPSEKLSWAAGIACSAAAIVVSSSARGPSAKFKPTVDRRSGSRVPGSRASSRTRAG